MRKFLLVLFVLTTAALPAKACGFSTFGFSSIALATPFVSTVSVAVPVTVAAPVAVATPVVTAPVTVVTTPIVATPFFSTFALSPFIVRHRVGAVAVVGANAFVRAAVVRRAVVVRRPAVRVIAPRARVRVIR